MKRRGANKKKKKLKKERTRIEIDNAICNYRVEKCIFYRLLFILYDESLKKKIKTQAQNKYLKQLIIYNRKNNFVLLLYVVYGLFTKLLRTGD